MKPNELLLERYIMTNDYPNSQFRIGDIVTRLRVGSGNTYRLTSGPSHEPDKNNPCISWPEQYPVVWRKLGWWEKRKTEDLPEYVKHTLMGGIMKAKEYDLQGNFKWVIFEKEKGTVPMGEIQYYVPASKNQFNKQQTNATEA